MKKIIFLFNFLIIFGIATVTASETTKKQIFLCGSRTIELDCENQNGVNFVKSDDFERELIRCNNIYGLPLKLGTKSNCKLSRENEAEFTSNTCNQKAQAFHCVTKGNPGQIIKLNVPCETNNGKCFVKETEMNKAKATCESVYNGEFKLSAVQVCKLPDEN